MEDDNFNLTYGELLTIFDGLDKLPKEATITYKSGAIKFDPVNVSDVKEKIKNRINTYIFVNEQLKIT